MTSIERKTAADGIVPSPTRARLSLVLLLYFLGIITVITLAPFHFAVPRRFDVMTTGNWFDVIANVLLFLPLGFLYPLTRPAEREPSVVHVAVLGLILSGAIETTQLFEPDRFTSVIDLATNATGAGLGALFLAAVMARIRLNAQLVGRLSLEIPLMGLIYLLVPLLLVVSFSVATEPMRLIALVPLGLLGARLISSVQQYHFAPSGLVGSRTIAAVAAGWMIVGTFPVILRNPGVGTALVVLVALTTWFESSRVAPAETGERRFEAEALRGAVPYIATYFVVMIFLPLALAPSGWHFALGLTGAGNDIDRQQFQLLEPVASLTVLGYLIAEARGRREQALRSSGGRVAIECGLMAMAIEASRGFQQDMGASGAQLALTVAAGVLGAGIYHSQREHVRWILAHRAGSSRGNDATGHGERPRVARSGVD